VRRERKGRRDEEGEKWRGEKREERKCKEAKVK